MSVLSPLWLVVAGLVGVGLVVAHLFSTTLPPRDVLPTARFVPAEPPLTVLRSRRVSDALLLALRLLVVAALGLAFAGAHCPRTAPARLVLVDLSRAVASAAELRDSVRAVPASARIAFDSTAKRVTSDSLVPSGARGSLSSALVAAHRAIADAPSERARTELVVVSPIVREELDSATATLLALWQGPVRFIRVRAASQPQPLEWEVRAAGDDPVRAALTAFERRHDGCSPDARAVCTPAARVVRTAPTRSDSLWARDSGGVLVLWPPAARTLADSQSGIATAQETVVAPFQRTSRLTGGHVLVRWLSGEPAATERAFGRGCMRDVAISVDPVGDLPLRESFRNIARSLVEPCGGLRNLTLAFLPRTAKRPAAVESSASASTLPLWLALFAAAVLLIEHRLRR